MKNLLNDQDPLPTHWQAVSKRQKEEWNKAWDKEEGEDWRDHTPGFEINGKGELRTKDYPLPKAPEADIPIPCVVSGFDISWNGAEVKFDLSEPIQFYAQAEPQTQPAVKPFRDALAEYKAGRRESYRAELEILGLSAEDIENELDELYPTDGWIPHKPGDPMPCDPDLSIAVQQRSGPNPYIRRAEDSMWHENPIDRDNDIIAWKPVHG